jgi:hypothetical protein
LAGGKPRCDRQFGCKRSRCNAIRFCTDTNLKSGLAAGARSARQRPPIYQLADHKENAVKTFMIATLATVLLASSTQAEERYYAAQGTGQFVSANDFITEGIATHLGLFDEVGSVRFGSTSDATAIPIEGWAIHTAANGDQLYELISGTLNGLTGAGSATMTYIGGTGRFVDASGTSRFSLQLLGGGSFKYAGEGVIDY